MNTEIYTSSIQLDTLISEKLRNSQFIFESHKMTKDQLKGEINTLRYLLYLTNQDRITLRSQLFPRYSSGQSISSKESVRKSLSKDFDDLNFLALYENTGNSSDINKVINTSILPYSSENTEREFSPFSAASPLNSPRLVINGEYVTTAVLSTEVTGIKQRCRVEGAKTEAKESFLEEKSENSSLDSEKQDISGLNCSNYLMQLQGDDDDIPYVFSEKHSRENSVNY